MTYLWHDRKSWDPPDRPRRRRLLIDAERQCDQLWRSFATLAKFEVMGNFFGVFVECLAKF